MRKKDVNDLNTDDKKDKAFAHQEACRERVLTRLWQLASLSHEMTRNSITGQIKALSMIVAIEDLVPDRRAAHKQPAPTAPEANIFKAPWLLKAQAKAAAEAAGFDVIEREDTSPAPEVPEGDPAVTPTPDLPPSPAPVAAKPVPSWAPSPYESFVPNASCR